jgi:hypothetical protein
MRISIRLKNWKVERWTSHSIALRCRAVLQVFTNVKIAFWIKGDSTRPKHAKRCIPCCRQNNWHHPIILPAPAGCRMLTQQIFARLMHVAIFHFHWHFHNSQSIRLALRDYRFDLFACLSSRIVQ